MVIAARCDAARAEDAAFAASTAGRRVGSFLHAGGVLRDATIPNQTAGGIARVVAPKVPGLVRANAAATAFVATDSRVIFSSVAATLGSAGQANYAATSAAADAWAAEQRGPRRRLRSGGVVWAPSRVKAAGWRPRMPGR